MVFSGHEDTLGGFEKPQWGAKSGMAERIIMNITIDEAVVITREYKICLAKNKDVIEDGETNVIEGEERKRKRDGENVKKRNRSDYEDGSVAM